MRWNAALVISILLISAMGTFQMTVCSGIFPYLDGMDEFKMDMNVSEVSLATYIGERTGDNSGKKVSGTGDVNGDGFADFLIGAPFNRDGGLNAGQVYLFFGRDNEWSTDQLLSDADASFIGERAQDQSAILGGVGDLNGDGYDDIIIGSNMNPDGGSLAGKTYVFFGKATGWTMDRSLSTADASFIGENSGDYSAYSISMAGDVNGDGFDDLLIGAFNNQDSGFEAGKTYLIFGKASGWSRNVDLSTADATFLGEDDSDLSGFCVAGGGDVNGDGYDDILIGAPGDEAGGGLSAGKTYLVFGKATGWTRNRNLSTADASFIGENEGDYAGGCIASVGDVNGDGYDDFLIGASNNCQAASNAGKTYLIFGKATGWSKNLDLSKADASFLGEGYLDYSGLSLSGAGDVNGDGYDDILIGAFGNDEAYNNAGQAYLVLGRAIGWSSNMSLSEAYASFIGESEGDSCGYSLSGVGDVNGDSLDDILIGSYLNDQGGANSGKSYLISGGLGYSEPSEVYDIKVMDFLGSEIKKTDKGETIHILLNGMDSNASRIDRAKVNVTFSRTSSIIKTILLVESGINTGVYKGTYLVPTKAEYFEKMRISAFIDNSKYAEVVIDYPFRPRSVTSLGVYSESSGTLAIDKLDIGQTGYIKCTGVDSNPTLIDRAFVNMSSDKNSSFKQMLILTETGFATGTYIGQYKVPSTMHYFENITLISSETPSIKSKLMVHTPVLVKARGPYLDAEEDQEYGMAFYNFGYNPVTWTMESNAYWLLWEEERKEVYGIPRNNDVGNGIWTVSIKAEDNNGNIHRIEYGLNVTNAPPKIITEPVAFGEEREEYFCDMDSDDDGQGDISWTLITNASFLTIEKKTGVLKGKPIDGEAGIYFVIVKVDDGNGGFSGIDFNLTILPKNDPPRIITTDIKQLEQDTPFKRDYDVFDPDEDDTHIWSLRTEAEWLAMENDTGVLWGTPDGYDVGDWLVNITVTDKGGLSDYREFTLKVLDLKDKPRFVDVPTDTELLHGTSFYFDVNASDADLNDRVTFSVRTEPESKMVIDPNTGDLRWKANYRSMPSTGKGMKVTLTASDGQLFSTYEFYIKVTPTQSPSSELVSPVKGARSRSAYTLLEWSGTDPENEPLTYVLYLADSEVNVVAKRSEDIVSNDIKDNYYNMTGLVQGKTYYWAVIPDDGCTYGKCLSGVFSFRVNNKPTVRSVDDQNAQAGKEFMVKVTGSDLDQDDTLTYRILSGPSGMMIRDSGMLVWTPKESQVGVHTVRVIVSDGYEETALSFRIEVSEGEGSGLGLIIGVVVGILVLVIIGLLLYIFVIKGKGEEEKKDEMDDEARKMLEEMEQKKREKEWEESHMRPSEQQVVSSVPLSAAEAHAQDKGGKPKSYEELYGRPAPDKSEELTTKELKDELLKLTEEMKDVEIEKNDINN